MAETEDEKKKGLTPLKHEFQEKEDMGYCAAEFEQQGPDHMVETRGMVSLVSSIPQL